MILDPIMKTYAVRAPDAFDGTRVGHGIIVFTTAADAENAIIQAPLHIMDPRERDKFDWVNATAHECRHVSTRLTPSGRTRITFEM